MTVAPGTRFGSYEVLAPIAAGGMGEVYRARDLALKRDVALKILPPSFVNDTGRMARFQREAEVLASLNHPNIAHIFGIAESGEIRALAMELAEGGSPQGPMPFEEAWKIASQIAEALSYAHDHGVIHRDLKPGNVKVTPDRTVKLLDFGLAKALTPERDASPGSNSADSPTVTLDATEAGVILGTAAYMSPEQARGHSVDKRADIWAFGVMLYELLTGRRPFEGEDFGDTLASVIKQEPDLGCVPAPAHALIRSCLEKDPKRRLRDIGDAWRLLSAPGDAAVPHVGPKLPWIVAAAGLVIAAAGGWLLHKPPVSGRQVLRLEIDPPPGGRFASDAMANGMALSPDGTLLTYVASAKDGVNRLWIRGLNEPSARPLLGTDEAQYPFWSPDGRTVAFFRNRKDLVRIDADGTGLQSVTAAPTARGGVWLPDGRIVFGSYTDKLRVVSANGGNSAEFSEDGHTWGGRWPQVLPGGRLMYFSERPSLQEDSAAYVTSLDKPGASRIFMKVLQSPIYVPGGGDTDYLLWQRGTALVGQALDRRTLKPSGPVAILADPVESGATEGQIYVTASARGPLIYSGIPRLTQFTWFDRMGRVLGTVGAPGRFHFGTFRISPDGQTIAAALDGAGGSRMVLLEVKRGVFNGLASSGNNSFPAWAPDSRTLAYGASVFDITTGTSIGGRGMSWDWSADGRDLIYGYDLKVQPMTPDRKPEGDARALSAEGMYARFSPDGHWVAFSSTESGQDEVYLDAFPNPRRKIRISTAGGNFPVWSATGHDLYYVQPGNQLMAVGLKFTAGSVQPSAPKELFLLPVSESPLSPFDVAKDGRFLVRADVPHASQSLTAIVNWQSLIR